MKRRELIKLGSTMLGGLSLGAVAGYGLKKSDKKDFESSNKVESAITPHQTAQFEYSSPMPLNKSLIDELYNLNQTLKKGKIVSLFSSIPNPLATSIHPILKNVRGANEDVKTIDDYLNLIRYAVSKGFKCVYALNTTMPVRFEEAEPLLDTLVPLFEKLSNAGIKDVKIANPFLLNAFYLDIKGFNIHLATTAEYHSAQIYKYVLDTVPSIKSINVSTDDNHNFTFLKSIKELFPNVKLEVLVNESLCLKYCMSRFYHPCTGNVGFECKKAMDKDPYLHIARNNLIHPWELEYYSAIGINNFKFTCNLFGRNEMRNIDFIKYYTQCADKGIDGYSANDFILKIHDGLSVVVPQGFKSKYKLSDIVKNLPDINYFVKNGEKCASECGTKCKYCYGFKDKLKAMESDTKFS